MKEFFKNLFMSSLKKAEIEQEAFEASERAKREKDDFEEKQKQDLIKLQLGLKKHCLKCVNSRCFEAETSYMASCSFQPNATAIDMCKMIFCTEYKKRKKVTK